MLHYKKLPYISPLLIFQCVTKLPGVIFLDSSKIDEKYGHYSFIMFEPLVSYVPAQSCCNRQSNIVVNNNITDAIALWQDVFEQNQCVPNADLPSFTGGLVGYFSYDLSKQLESIPAFTKSAIPDYILSLYNKVFAFNQIKQECFILVHEVAGFNVNASDELEHLLLLYEQALATNSNSLAAEITLPKIKISSNFTEEEYCALLLQAREYILAGEAYEINLAQCFSGKVATDYPVLDLYKKLRELNSAPFSAYLDLQYITGLDLQILSASPERFLAIRNRHLEARPIKGTIGRSSNLAKDQKLMEQLTNSEKDRAENIMIVDLLRNDLGKICKTGSIEVSQLCGIESFTNVHHMVSVINGELKEDKSIFDIILAAFPGGSITGAPKIRAMQIIEELERTSRGVYCGSIGYFGFNGNVDLNVAIRTVVRESDELKFYAGGAITLDSDPASEYAETLLKAEKIFEVINSNKV